MTVLSADDRPTDPPPLDGADVFCAETVRWWQTWATSPQAVRFLPTDWSRLQMLAQVVDQFHREPSVKLLGEIRLNESLLGATVVDRQRLQMEVKPPAEPSKLEVLKERRRVRVIDPRFAVGENQP